MPALKPPTRCLLIVLALCLSVMQGALAKEPLRIVAATSWSMPFGQFQGEQLVGGLVYDLGHAVADALGAKAVFVPLPRKRIDAAALAGQVDLRCYVSPQWVDWPEHFVWGEPLFSVSDVLIRHASAPNYASIDEIPAGTVVSAVLGYRYPALEAAFASGQLRREDTVDQEKVLLKVTAGRTPLGVANSLALDWYQRSTPQHQLADWRLPIASVPIHCAMPKASPWAGSRLQEALAELKRSGRIEQILRNYR